MSGKPNNFVREVAWSLAAMGGVPMGGDLGGTLPAPTVTGLQGTPVCVTAPTTGQLLAFDGTEWCPTAPGITVKDEGVALATLGTALDFVGAGVVASGTGTTKTVTIPGGGTPSGAAGGDLSGTYPNPSVVDDSHSHTASTLPVAAGTEHAHVGNVTFSGDGSTTAFELPAAPFDAFSVAAYVAGVRLDVTLSGTMLTTATFALAPASGTDNILVDIVAAAA